MVLPLMLLVLKAGPGLFQLEGALYLFTVAVAVLRHELALVVLDPEVELAAAALLAVEELDELPHAASAATVTPTPKSVINLAV